MPENAAQFEDSPLLHLGLCRPVDRPTLTERIWCPVPSSSGTLTDQPVHYACSLSSRASIGSPDSLHSLVEYGVLARIIVCSLISSFLPCWLLWSSSTLLGRIVKAHFPYPVYEEMTSAQRDEVGGWIVKRASEQRKRNRSPETIC